VGAPTLEALADESRRVRKVRQLVDIATALILQSNLTVDDAERLVAGVRAQILALFPDGEEVYELIDAPRFRRLIHEYAPSPHHGVVIPFPIRRV
jgi:hypothetical protein